MTNAPVPPWRLAAFGIVQVAILAAGGLLATQGLARQEQQRQPPKLRTEPLEVRPRHNDPTMISDEELSRVLTRLQPVLGPHPKINHVDHALRMWTSKAQFPDPEAFSGNDLREILLDHRRFTQAWGDDVPAFLMTSPHGIRPRLLEGEASASHTDHTLACLAESLTPLDFPVITARGETRVESILRRSLHDFSLNQVEYEWSALAYALYVQQPQWMTTEGQQITFNRLADRIIRQDLPQGVCLGNHRLHALVMLLRVDEQTPLLTPETRTQIHEFLAGVVQKLVKSQHEEGWWDDEWMGGPKVEAEGTEKAPPTLSIRILATGHALEWMALAPPELHAPHENRVRAARWLVQTIEPMSRRQVQLNYTFLTHAGRALALWRGKLPHEVPLLPAEPDASAGQ